MADYYAHYVTRFYTLDPENLISGRKWGNSWTETYPIVGFRDDEALICDSEGKLRKVSEFLETEHLEGSGTPDEEGEMFTVHFEVTTYPGGEEE